MNVIPQHEWKKEDYIPEKELCDLLLQLISSAGFELQSRRVNEGCHEDCYHWEYRVVKKETSSE